ncbi:radical SAM protein [candidate division KSB1 bacterium]|nr:radical SAM protein [candidate division KSB1 bacterium]RQW07129.1 MAG: radical SAM protein [candidate division KSB1 bacterium]
MAIAKKSVLLFNPWIYDFAAYDFWIKPIGLLYIGAVLRRLGYHVHLLDCLDRFHPAQNTGNDRSPRADVSGKFHREIIAKPPALDHVPRFYARYGMPTDLVSELLSSLTPPSVICLTSSMIYWYPAVIDAATLLRDFFPKAHIILGGIYPTLCPEHAEKHVAPDHMIQGEGEVKAVRLIAQLLDSPGADFDYVELDELPFPAFDLYPILKSIPLLTSRGCPNDCSFCASKQLAAGYRRRSAANVVQEIAHWYENRHVSHFAFFDDALAHRASMYLQPMLRSILDTRWPVTFYTPNGLTPRFLNKDIADLFFAVNVKNVRLSFETSDVARQQAMSAKVTNAELIQALDNLELAGYQRAQIGVYVMMGLPGQTIDEVRRSILYVHFLGARVHLASYSPIPGTREWHRAIADRMWDANADLLLTNTTIFPIWSRIVGYEKCVELVQWTKELNRKLL